MEKFFRSDYAWGANSKNDADNIKRAVEILKRIINDNYLEEALKPFYEKYPDYKFEFKTEPCENNPKLYRMIDNDTEEQKKLRFECYAKEDEMRQKDYDEFYKYLKEHIQEWWD
jgi:hypothetical protein